jgi:hypothetical protein
MFVDARPLLGLAPASIRCITTNRGARACRCRAWYGVRTTITAVAQRMQRPAHPLAWHWLTGQTEVRGLHTATRHVRYHLASAQLIFARAHTGVLRIAAATALGCHRCGDLCRTTAGCRRRRLRGRAATRSGCKRTGKQCYPRETLHSPTLYAQTAHWAYTIGVVNYALVQLASTPE